MTVDASENDTNESVMTPISRHAYGLKLVSPTECVFEWWPAKSGAFPHTEGDWKHESDVFTFHGIAWWIRYSYSYDKSKDDAMQIPVKYKINSKKITKSK